MIRDSYLPYQRGLRQPYPVAQHRNLIFPTRIKLCHHSWPVLRLPDRRVYQRTELPHRRRTLQRMKQTSNMLNPAMAIIAAFISVALISPEVPAINGSSATEFESSDTFETTTISKQVPLHPPFVVGTHARTLGR